MAEDIQTAIKAAEKDLKEQRAEALKKLILEFLKQEYNSIEDIEEKIKKLQENKRIHEENIKNVKSGNLDAIEKRRRAINANWDITFTHSILPYINYSNDRFFNDFVAGNTFNTTNGKLIVF